MGKPPAIPVSTLNLTDAASGNSGSLGVGSLDLLAIDLTVVALTNGATAVQFFLERLNMDGNWYLVWASTSITGPGAASTSVGPGCATNAVLGQQVRLRWAVTGAGGGVTATGGMIGR